VALLVRLLDASAALGADDGQTAPWTPLWLAVCGGHADCARELLARGASRDAASADGETPLHAATWYRHESCVALLLDAGAPVDGRTDDGYTALHWAVAWDDVAIVRLLLAAGADATLGSPVVRTAFDDARSAACSALLRAPLHDAARRDDVSAFDVLLRPRKLNVNAADAQDGGATPLHVAAMLGHVDSVRLLLDAGADTTRIDADGHTALDVTLKPWLKPSTFAMMLLCGGGLWGASNARRDACADLIRRRSVVFDDATPLLLPV